MRDDRWARIRAECVAREAGLFAEANARLDREAAAARRRTDAQLARMAARDAEIRERFARLGFPARGR